MCLMDASQLERASALKGKWSILRPPAPISKPYSWKPCCSKNRRKEASIWISKSQCWSRQLRTAVIYSIACGVGCKVVDPDREFLRR